MITFNGKPLCDHCNELPQAITFDGWELCLDCLLVYKRHVQMIEDSACDPSIYDAYIAGLTSRFS